MQSLLDIRVQKLFLVTIVLKVFSSFIGWRFQMQWSFGFAIPLTFMMAYVLLGLKRRDHDVTDEKFADTCYYLGFIFTITSIIFSLFDLPSIGTKLQEIAVRFGAAMVSTVVGLVVRVYLVSFKKDGADAIRDAEESVIDASQRFREHLVIANERLRDFHSAVDTAAKETVERVHAQVESLSRNHADKLTDFFTDLTARNQSAFTEALTEVRAATMRLSKAVDGYSDGMRANLTSIDAKVEAFAAAVSNRLQNTTFPDDFFVQHLTAPMDQIRHDASALSDEVKQASGAVADASKLLGTALRKLNEKATATDGAMESVLRITTQQYAVLDAAKGQLAALERVEDSMARFDALLDHVTTQLRASNTVSSEVLAQVKRVVGEAQTTREALHASLGAVIDKMESNAKATGLVADRIAQGAGTSDAMLAGLQASTSAAASLTSQLKEVAETERTSAALLQELGGSAGRVFERMETAVGQLQAVALQLRSIEVFNRAKVDVPRTPPAPSDIHLPRGLQPGVLDALPRPADVAVANPSSGPVLSELQAVPRTVASNAQPSVIGAPSMPILRPSADAAAPAWRGAGAAAPGTPDGGGKPSQ